MLCQKFLVERSGHKNQDGPYVRHGNFLRRERDDCETVRNQNTPHSVTHLCNHEADKSVF